MTVIQYLNDSEHLLKYTYNMFQGDRPVIINSYTACPLKKVPNLRLKLF